MLVLAGCSLAPTYEVPSTPAIATFKEAPQAELKPDERGTWKVAQPSEEVARGQWWTVFQDPKLNNLEEQALAANQNLAAAAARVKEARAMNQAARAGFFPSLDAGFGPTRQKVSAASLFEPDGTNVPQQTLWRAQASVSYEVDLFGRVTSTVDASKADMQQSEALFRSVQLALQADVAQNYFALRELDAESQVFASAVDLREQALKLVQRRYTEGEITELDVSRAQSELATARSDAMTVQRLRATSEHSLAVLLGKAPAEFSMAADPLKPVTLRIPPGLPSSLLERRPDIAAAERAMAAANARVGVAKAAFFPSLTLTGAGGFESATIGDLFKWSSRAFLLGPLAGTSLNIPIFDGGRRKGNLANARAVYDEDVANYRQQVLTAFREVEDNLSDMRIRGPDKDASRSRQCLGSRGAVIADAVHGRCGQLPRRNRRRAYGAAVPSRRGAVTGRAGCGDGQPYPRAGWRMGRCNGRHRCSVARPEVVVDVMSLSKPSAHPEYRMGARSLEVSGVER